LEEVEINIDDIGGFQEVAVLNALRGFEPLRALYDVMKF
jgi:hypothetical protein